MSESTKTSQQIEIYVDGTWAGSGRHVDGQIVDCSAQFSDDSDESDEVYDMLDDVIRDGHKKLVAELVGKTITVTWTLV